jgi:hypothetical protein
MASRFKAIFKRGDKLSFDKGPYPDLRPSRRWRDVLEVVAIDDRRGIEVLWGHYNLRTDKVEFEVGPCSPN